MITVTMPLKDYEDLKAKAESNEQVDTMSTEGVLHMLEQINDGIMRDPLRAHRKVSELIRDLRSVPK